MEETSRLQKGQKVQEGQRQEVVRKEKERRKVRQTQEGRPQKVQGCQRLQGLQVEGRQVRKKVKEGRLLRRQRLQRLVGRGFWQEIEKIIIIKEEQRQRLLIISWLTFYLYHSFIVVGNAHPNGTKHTFFLSIYNMK